MNEFPLDPGGLEGWFLDAGGALQWPTAQVSYLELADQTLQGVVDFRDSLGGYEPINRVLDFKVSNIVQDLIRIGCLAIDAANCRQKGSSGMIDCLTNPVAHYLHHGGDPCVVPFARNDWPQKSHAFADGVKGVAKYALLDFQGRIWRPSRRLDIASINELVALFVQSDERMVRRMFLYLEGRPFTNVIRRKVAPVADEIARRFAVIAERRICDEAILRRLATGARRVVHAHLGQAWDDWTRIKRSKRYANMAEVLVTGTPKYLGRLLSGLHRERGGAVYRFAHGGERAFFDDSEWPVNEFLEADRYYCFGRGEAENVARRLCERRVPNLSSQSPAFVGMGTPRHRVLRERSIRSPVKTRGRILYMPNKYIGEALYLSPRFRVNDVLYFEWQIWLLNSLSQEGYEVVVKIHPAESPTRIEAYRKIASTMRSDPVDLAVEEVACVLFDFAGTAFFDAMATQQSIVLLDNGARAFDSRAREDLADRISIVPVDTNENNVLRSDPKAIVRGIERARDLKCTATFFERYYCGEFFA